MRSERDPMGEVLVPADALYGAQTARAVANFPISGLRMPRELIRAIGLIKAAAARVNQGLLLLDAVRAEAIERAALEVAEGVWDAHFPVDVFQSGSGTSTNMNANEVIAHRAEHLLGEGIRVHPNDHVNLGQSSNDVIPSAISLASQLVVQTRLIPALERLSSSLSDKASAWDDIVKIGRTHLQDAMPIRLGQEFSSYAHLVARSAAEVRHAACSLNELALGGTAVGTGTSTHPEFGRRVAAVLAEMTGFPLQEASHHVAAQSYPLALAALSASIAQAAGVVYKVANDIRWMGSGPRAGLGELVLPALQPGSSIMPGKVNPVMAEAVMMVCVQVMGLDLAVRIGASQGNFELATMLPLLGYDLLTEASLLANGVEAFRERLVEGLEVDRERIEALVERSLALATPLAAVVGYDEAARIAHEAHHSGRTIREVAAQEGILPPEALERALDLRRLTEPGFTIGRQP